MSKDSGFSLIVSETTKPQARMTRFEKQRHRFNIPIAGTWTRCLYVVGVVYDLGAAWDPKTGEYNGCFFLPEVRFNPPFDSKWAKKEQEKMLYGLAGMQAGFGRKQIVKAYILPPLNDRGLPLEPYCRVSVASLQIDEMGRFLRGAERSEDLPRKNVIAFPVLGRT